MKKKIKKQFNNLKTGAKNVFVGFLILCMLSTATGIGSIFVYADNEPGSGSFEEPGDDSGSSGDESGSDEGSDENGSDEGGEDSGEDAAGEGSGSDTSDDAASGAAGTGSEYGEGSETGTSGDTGSDAGAAGEGSGTGTGTGDGAVTPGAGEAEELPTDGTVYGEDGLPIDGGELLPEDAAAGATTGIIDTEASDGEHLHDYSYFDNGDGLTHTRVCTDPGCEQNTPVIEDHDFGEWVSDGQGHHTRTCALCEYREIEDCVYDEITGRCLVCDYDPYAIEEEEEEIDLFAISKKEIRYDGDTTMDSYYLDKVTISADGYLVSTSKDGEYKDEVEITPSDLYTVSGSKQKAKSKITLYFKEGESGKPKAMDISGLKVYYDGGLSGLTYKDKDGKESTDKADYYLRQVTISKDGYLVCKAKYDSSNDSYSSPSFGSSTSVKCTTDDVDSEGNVHLFFLAKGTDPLGVYLVREQIKIAEKEELNGKITVEDYTSKTFQKKNSTAKYVKKDPKISITANAGLVDVSKIEYYVATKFLSSPEEVAINIKENNSAWRTYSNEFAPTLDEDKKNYVYARITDSTGNYLFLSTGAVIFDKVAPKMTVNKVTKNTDGDGALVALAATDSLSGVNRFKMVVKEKTDNMEVPDKDYMFNEGIYIEVKKTEDKEAVSSYKYTGTLDPEKTYIFYFVAVDRAGNISSVTNQEVKGSDINKDGSASGSSSGSGSGSGSGSSSGSGSGSGSSSGMTPAPNGIADGGKSTKPSTAPTNVAGKSTPEPTAAETIANTPISRNPYIAEATGNTKIGETATSGWDKISGEVKKADKGASIEVEMSGLSNVSAELFSSMKENDVNVKLRMPESIKWEISSTDLVGASARDIDLGVRLGSKNIPAPVLNEVVGSYPHVEFSIKYEGDFGFTATIAVPVGESNKGMNGTLYHYDTEKKELEVAGNCVIDQDGYARFALTHASDYTVVISPEKILAPAEVTAQFGELTQPVEEEAKSSSMIRLTDIFKFRGSVRIWLFFIAFLSAAFCVAILFMPQLQNRNDSGDK